MEFDMESFINQIKLLVVDTETGGFDPEEHSILSIGAVVWRPFEILDSKEVLISEPEINYDEEALAVNKIDIEYLKENGLAPLEAIKELEDFVDSYFSPNERMILAGHNIWFDIRFIERLYKIAGRNFREKFAYRLLDTASLLLFLSESNVISVDKPSLDDAIKYFKIDPPKKRHSAIDDAIATSMLLSDLFKIRLVHDK
jgi:DNA polymerase-3 subunit epsilon